MNRHLADALVEIHVSSLELLGASLGVVEILRSDHGPLADDLRTVCLEAVRISRSFPRAPGPALLVRRVGLVRSRLEAAGALLRRAAPVAPRCRPYVSAGMEIVERGMEAAARANRTLGPEPW